MRRRLGVALIRAGVAILASLLLQSPLPRYGSSKRMYVRARLAEVDRQHRRGWQPVWSVAGRG